MQPCYVYLLAVVSSTIAFGRPVPFCFCHPGEITFLHSPLVLESIVQNQSKLSVMVLLFLLLLAFFGDTQSGRPL